jgi:hypothetical protein
MDGRFGRTLSFGGVESWEVIATVRRRWVLSVRVELHG